MKKNNKIKKPFINPNFTKKEKTLFILKIVLYEFLAFFIGLSLTVFIFRFQIDKVAITQPILTIRQIQIKICNAFSVTSFIILLIGWLILMVNLNVLSAFLYGTKTFLLVLIGRRPKQTYYDYIQDRKEKPIPKIYYISMFVLAVPFIIVALSLYLGFGLYK